MHAGPNSEGLNEYLADTHASLHMSMTPEMGLWDMNAKVLERIAEMVNKIEDEGEEMSLWGWVRDGFTKATSEALYGDFHPLAEDPGLVEAVWSVLFPYLLLRQSHCTSSLKTF